MVNKVILIGNVGKLPEKKEVGSAGNSITTFSVATTFKTKDDKVVQWHNIVTWNKLADICEKYVKKGDLVYVEGRIETSTWEKPDGSKGYSITIVANEVKILKSSAANLRGYIVDGDTDNEKDQVPF